MNSDRAIILILTPLNSFGIVTANLKRVFSLSQNMMAEGRIRRESIDDGQQDLQQAARLCEEIQSGNLYARYANKKVFKCEDDLWQSKEATVRTHIKRMADMRLTKIVSLAEALDIPILYTNDKKSQLNISERLHLNDKSGVTPVMEFIRHDEGTSYRLRLRIGDKLIDNLQEKRLTVLAYDPAMFILDGLIYKLDEGFSGKLLLPFEQKAVVEIPRRIENDYFRRFILKHVASAEITAKGFDISDIIIAPHPILRTESTIDGQHLLSLRFRYDNTEYSPNDRSRGRVTLTEADGTFQFVRQLRNRQVENETIRLLQQTEKDTNTNGEIRFLSLQSMIEWLRQHAAGLRSHGFDVVQPSDHLYYIGPLNVEQSDVWLGDWLQTEVTIVINDGNIRIPFRQLRDTILQGEQEFMLPTGERLMIPREWIQRYADLLIIGQPKGQGFLRHRSQVDRHPADEARTNPDTALPPAGCQQVSTPDQLRATLRPYQTTGFQWLWQNLLAQTGCCLSDEMGLGKTLQTITLLLKYKEQAKHNEHKSTPVQGMLFSEEEMQGNASNTPNDCTLQIPYRTSLVVAPASVVHNWRNELARFAPSLTVLTYTGDTAKRQDKRLAMTRWDVVLTTYRTLLNDIDHLSRLTFGIIVFDESQAFKTSTSQIHEAVTQLDALHRVALSGTPVENDLNELWSLMSVLNPNLLGERASFQKAFATPIARQMEESRRELLRRLIAPYFLKRTKDEVLSDLPERQEEVVTCPLSSSQASRYAEELSKARNEWLDPHSKQQRREIYILAALQRLRQIANGEGKLSVVFDYLQDLRHTKHKVLIFSEYVKTLEQVGCEMKRRGWTYALLTGQTQDREQVIERFQEDAGCQFFLISLKAGGVGLNLTAADYVFLLDPWWNHSAEEQAIARAHRIGQHMPVFVYRFVAADTLEEQILTLQDRKQSLIDSVMPFIL